MKDDFFDFRIFALEDPAGWQQNFSGKNARGVFVVFQGADEDKTPLKSFLTQILAAVRLDVERDITCLMVPHGTVLSWSLLRSGIKVDTVIAFGFSPAQLGLRFKTSPYLPVQVGGVTFLFADNLGEILTERQQDIREKASALWGALQEMFPLEKDQ